MTDVNTEEETLEPTPYENAYRRTLMDDDPAPEASDPEILDLSDGDTPELEGMIQAQDSKEHDWKKRYSDLKSYHDRKNNEWLQQEELTQAKLKLAQQDARMKEVEDRIESLRKTEQEAQVRTAEKELLSVHPDFLEIKSDPEFLSWLEEQPSSIADGVYKNRTDSKWAARVVDLYKSDKDIGQKKRGRPRKTEAEAAKAVTKTEKASASSSEGEKKIMNLSLLRRNLTRQIGKEELYHNK